MDKEDKFWLAVWTVVAISVTIITVTYMATDTITKINCMSNGYEQAVLPGSSTQAWVKVK